MARVSIDAERCKKDGICVRYCPASVFSQDRRGTVPAVEGDERCISCGQCVAICRQGAVSHEDFPPGSISPIESDRQASWEQLADLLRSRRSIRAFRDRQLERDAIEKIVDGARYAPSGHNSQSTEFLVVQDGTLLSEICSLTVGYLRFEVKRFGNPLFRAMVFLADREMLASGLREIEGFKYLIWSFESGKDLILFHAPTLLVFHARRSIGYADVNASLAAQNASLVAHSLGVGHFYAGWVVSACRAPLAPSWRARLPRLLGLPPENTVYGALAMGYPLTKFENWIERKPARLRWA